LQDAYKSSRETPWLVVIEQLVISWSTAIMLREIAYGVLGLVVAAYSIDFGLALFDDPREPQRIRSSIPLLGHLLGLSTDGIAYFNKSWYASDPAPLS
jgi:hypothetical protein